MTRDRRALVTGATGYIGTHLCSYLAQGGWDVHAMVRRDSVRRSGGEESVTRHRIEADLSNLDDIIEVTSPDIVFNLAAAMPGNPATEDPQTAARRLAVGNVDLPAALGRSLSQYDRPAIIHAASWWEWDAQGNPHTPETAPNAYTRSKIIGRHVLDEAAGNSAIALSTLVVHDTYGPHDWRGKVLNILVRAAVSGNALAMSPGAQMMDLVHVHDVVRAFARRGDAMLESSQAETTVGAISSGERMSLKAVAAAVESAAQKKLDVTWGAQPYRPGTPMAVGVMAPPPPDWHPTVALPDGLAALVDEERQSGRMN